MDHSLLNIKNNMVYRLFTSKANKFSSFAPALKGVKKINLLPSGWGKQIDFHTMNFYLVNKRTIGKKICKTKNRLGLSPQ
jgi:hypothetical protein